jgi:FKBP-type peptidyl-prolyl cis-trans isomerase (trigger factor)
MQIRSQKREGNKIFLEVEEERTRFEESLDKALREAGNEIRLPGFRPGKAPRELVERAMSREALEQRASQNLIAEIYSQLIDEAKIDPVDYPNIEIVQQEKDKSFIFKLSVDVYPLVKLGKYKGLKAQKKSALVTEEEILSALGNLQERFAVVGEGGQKKLFPLDDAFAQKVSRCGTLAQLKEEIQRVLQEEKAAEAQADLKNQLIAAAGAETSVEIPASMVEREVDVMLDELKTSLAQSRLTLEDYLKGAKKEEKALREEMRKSAQIRVKGKIVLEAVARAEKIEISSPEMESEVKALSEASSQSPADFEKQLTPGGRKYMEDYLRRNKALNFLIEQARLSEGQAQIKEEKK